MDTTDKAMPIRRRALHRLTLRVLFSGGAGIIDRAPLPLRQGGVLIGRTVTEQGALCLPDDRLVSRVHAVIQTGPEGRGAPRILDLSRNNGVRINGNEAREGPLRDGDVVRIGNSFLLLRAESEEEEGEEDEELRGGSPAMRSLRRRLRIAGPTPATVLLLGESGAGKEVAARMLHRLSGREGPLLALNCSAIPESLAESQLFGHVAGAFTGAAARPGFFRAAQAGTLFLDEIGDLALALQPKLLRAIEERAVIPVGATSPVPCDLRIVAATNRDLGAALETGTFRGDLYARLAELTVRLPPLRERREDILPLLLRALGTDAPALAPDLVEAVLLHSWPYNVRELLKLAAELRLRGAEIEQLDLVRERLARPAPAQSAVEVHFAPNEVRQGDRPIPDREQLLLLLREHNGVIADIARALGRSRMQVYRWLAQHELDAAAFRTER